MASQFIVALAELSELNIQPYWWYSIFVRHIFEWKGISMAWKDLSKKKVVDEQNKCVLCGNNFCMADLRIYNKNEFYNRGSNWGDLFYICVDCSDSMSTCEDCGEYIIDDFDEVCHGLDNERYCADCFGEHYGYCEDCGCVIPSNESYCEDCREFDEDEEDDYDDAENNYDWLVRNGYLSGYNQKSFSSTNGELAKDFIKKNPAELLLGVELEVSVCNNFSIADAIRLIRTKHKHIYGNAIVKYDRSVQKGFEICTLPMKIEDHKKWNGWDSILELAKANYVLYKNSFNYGCGMHIHINRKAFNKAGICRFVSFFHGVEYKTNIHFITTIAQRQSEAYSRIYHKDSTQCSDRAGVGTRHDAINTLNRDTIEIRIFSSIVDRDIIFKNIEFAHAMVKFCNEYKGETPLNHAINYKEFVQYLFDNKKEYPSLVKFLEEESYSAEKEKKNIIVPQL